MLPSAALVVAMLQDMLHGVALSPMIGCICSHTIPRRHCHRVCTSVYSTVAYTHLTCESRATDACFSGFGMLSYLGGKVIGGILRSLKDLPGGVNVPPLQLRQSPQSLQNAVHVTTISQVFQANVPAAAPTLSLCISQGYWLGWEPSVHKIKTQCIADSKPMSYRREHKTCMAAHRPNTQKRFVWLMWLQSAALLTLVLTWA